MLKKTFYKTVAERLSKELGVRIEVVLIRLVEVKKENGPFGNGIAQYAYSLSLGLLRRQVLEQELLEKGLHLSRHLGARAPIDQLSRLLVRAQVGNARWTEF